MSDLYEMPAADLIEFAKKWSALGDAVQTQAMYICIVDYEAIDPFDLLTEANPNAIKLVKERIGGMNAEIDEAIDRFEKKIRGIEKREEE